MTKKYLPKVYEHMKEYEFQEFNNLYPNIPKSTFYNHHSDDHFKTLDEPRDWSTKGDFRKGNKGLAHYTFSFDTYKYFNYSVVRLAVKTRNDDMYYFLKFKELPENKDYHTESYKDLKELTQKGIYILGNHYNKSISSFNSIYFMSDWSKAAEEFIKNDRVKNGELSTESTHSAKFEQCHRYLRNHTKMEGFKPKAIASNIHIIGIQNFPESFDKETTPEAGWAYILGECLEENHNSTCYGRVQSSLQEGKDIHFEPPDIDILEIRSSEIYAYEVKRYSQNMKRKCYTAIGQAINNLICKVNREESKGLINKSYIALPYIEKSWFDDIKRSLREFPIGIIFIDINSKSIEEILPAKESPYLDAKFQEWFLESCGYELRENKRHYRRYIDGIHNTLE